MSKEKIEKLMEYMSEKDGDKVKRCLRDILKEKAKERILQSEKED